MTLNPLRDTRAADNVWFKAWINKLISFLLLYSISALITGCRTAVKGTDGVRGEEWANSVRGSKGEQNDASLT